MGTHKWIPRAAAVTIGLGAAIVIGEILLRILGIGYGKAPLESHDVFHHVHPRNYTFMSHDPRGEFGGHIVHYNNDRMMADPDSPAAGRKGDYEYRIAFMGDSFVAAIEVPYAQSFAGRLQASAGDKARIHNYGVSSYSPALYLLQWRHQVSRFEPTHVFLLLFENDISDDAFYAARGVYADDGTLVAVRGDAPRWVVRILRKSYLARFLRKSQLKIAWVVRHWKKRPHAVAGPYVEINPDITELTASNVRELAREVGESGAEFALMAVPSKYRLQSGQLDTSPEFSDKWNHWAAENQIRFLDLVAPFRREAENGTALFFGVDPHFNENGHRLTAQVLRAAYPDVFE